MGFISRKRVALMAGVASVTIGGVVAVAYFTSSGTGTGNGAVGTSSNWAVSTVAYTGGPLYPASGSETIGFTVTNTNAGKQAINSITTALTHDGAGGVFDVHSNAYVDGCQAGWFTVTNTVPTFPDDLAGTSPGPAGSYSGTATLTMQDSGGPQDACQSLQPQITVSVN
jgi:hypothetical protein